MASSPAFVLSEAVDIELSDASLSIRHAGDVVIEQSLGRELASVRSGGDLTVRLDRITGTLEGAGTVTLHGAIEAEVVRGARVVIGDQAVKCKAIVATESIVIGAGRLQVDVIQAPEVRVDPNASGRVTVMECHNERPATKIKGGFSLTDYEDMFGDAEGFLAARGLQPLGASAAAPARPAKLKAPEPLKRPTKPARAPEPEVIAPPALPDEEEVELSAPVAPPEDDDEDEEVDDPLSLSLDDLEPLVEAGTNDAAEMRVKLNDALKRITACYDGQDIPPAVSELRALVEDGDIDALSNNITEVWNGLLGFHQKRGIRPHHQVTHAFNVIHSLVQR